MHSVALIALVSCVAHAHAEEVPAHDMQNSMDDFDDEMVEKLANKLVDRVQALFPQTADLDATTLGKSGNQAIPVHNNLPAQPWYEEEQGEGRTIGETDDEQEPVLDWVVSLRGGAAMKAMKAMAAAKSPRPSEKKKKKPMNAYFTKLAAARKSNAKSFEYNGKTYVAAKAKSGMIIYKAK